ncbi:hypothetical protein [Burkholderia ubonensis]|uniref:hypothetical protein n=1 Tax=Burkholderia ubonensis TaxID=101571 RepID=UPI0007C66227|nr:hypothetical protein [Burkholderia ubonensis]
MTTPVPPYQVQGTVQKTIPSYLYWQYNDDPNLQAFVNSYNQITQNYVDTFNQLNLPVYTGSLITGALLDWVANGIYGQTRPSLPSGKAQAQGAYDTAAYDSITYNTVRLVGQGNFYVTTDDVFKRILTWNLYKGDGRAFTVRWLKRRIVRFLVGANGIDPGVNQTYQVSVTFGPPNVINIRLLKGVRTVTGGAYNTKPFNAVSFNSVTSFFTQLTAFPLAPILQSAIQSGAVQLPFQFQYVVTTQ